MMLFAVSLIPVTVTVGLIGLSVGLALCLVRLVIGPTLADRVVALDLMTILLVGVFIVDGIEEPQHEPLQVATVLALINFLGTVGFAIYLERKARRD